VAVRTSQQNRVVTMEDVAARAGVSRALVSIVFRGVPGASKESRARVRQAAEELSYRPDQRARLLGRNRSRTIGIAFGLHDEFHGELVEAFYQAAEHSGYELVLSPVAPTRRETHAVQSLLDYRCEALVLIGPHQSRRALEGLAERVPVVVVARAVRSTELDVVRTDDAAGARLAVEHLIHLGHRRITHVHGHRAPGAAERRAGYRQAMHEAGLDAYVALIQGGLTEDHGTQAADCLLTGSRPTAVFAFNDHCSAGLITRLREHGVHVPHDLSVVGYDNTRIAHSAAFPLTTIAQDSGTLAHAALEHAIGRTETIPTDPTDVIIAPNLIVRNTTTSPRAEFAAPVGVRVTPPPIR
jgi:DNA-binding LacI/PurR family transcriptional regulator